MLFSWVLLLLVGFTLPCPYEEGTEDVQDLVADLHLGPVTDKLVGSSPFPNVVLQSVDKLLICLDTIDICDQRVSAHEEYSRSGTIINSWYISVDEVTCHGFIASMDI